METGSLSIVLFLFSFPMSVVTQTHSKYAEISALTLSRIINEHMHERVSQPNQIIYIYTHYTHYTNTHIYFYRNMYTALASAMANQYQEHTHVRSISMRIRELYNPFDPKNTRLQMRGAHIFEYARHRIYSVYTQLSHSHSFDRME